MGDIFITSPPKQTLKAWEPFWDCVSILFQFQNSDVDEECSEWRLFWIAGIALLRTIGHALAKSDAATSIEHKNMIDKLWDEWKSDPEHNAIFWEFIEQERNNLLKTYEFGAVLAQDDVGFYVKYTNGDGAFELF